MLGKFSFNHSSLKDEEIYDYLGKRDNVTIISFISPYSGIPHMCPVWGIFTDGRFFFQTEDYSFKVKFVEKGNDKIGVSIVDPSLFPDYSEDSVPYISFGGTAIVRTKQNFNDFGVIIQKIFLKYVTNEKERTELIKIVLKEKQNRILVEVLPEWIKIAKVPKRNKDLKSY